MREQAPSPSVRVDTLYVMGLDDAIRAARQQADHIDQMSQQQAERKLRERREADELLKEALERLRPYDSEVFVRVKHSTFGKYRGSDGYNYKAVSEQRCWTLQKMEGDHPTTECWYNSPLLLLEDGTAVRAWLDAQGEPGEYLSTLEPTPLGEDYYPMLSANTRWNRALEKSLGEAIVRYERGDI